MSVVVQLHMQLQIHTCTLLHLYVRTYNTYTHYHTYVHTYLHMYYKYNIIRTYAYQHTRTYTCTYIPLCAYVRAPIARQSYVHSYVRKYNRTYACTFIYIHTHTYPPYYRHVAVCTYPPFKHTKRRRVFHLSAYRQNTSPLKPFMQRSSSTCYAQHILLRSSS